MFVCVCVMLSSMMSVYVIILWLLVLMLVLYVCVCCAVLSVDLGLCDEYVACVIETVVPIAADDIDVVTCSFVSVIGDVMRYCC